MVEIHDTIKQDHVIIIDQLIKLCPCKTNCIEQFIMSKCFCNGREYVTIDNIPHHNKDHECSADCIVKYANDIY